MNQKPEKASQSLSRQSCQACEGKMHAMRQEQVREYLKRLNGWRFTAGKLVKEFEFQNYYETVSFVNAVAWIAHRQNHHPEIEFGYRRCKIGLVTHAVKGISINDFIVAAKIDVLT